MKTKFTQEELEKFIFNACELFEQACTSIEETLESNFEISEKDYDDENKADLITNLKDYLCPWNAYDIRINAMHWLLENGYIEKEND